jgi:hypothetical protein
MKKNGMTTTEALSAWKLAQDGRTLDEIKALLGLRCSRVCVWRSIRKVTTADERIKAASASGNFEPLCVGEMLLMLHPPKEAPANGDAPQE